MSNVHKLLAQSVLAYDAAINHCQGDPESMMAYKNYDGDRIADIYFRMLEQARFVLSQPDSTVVPEVTQLLTKWKHNKEEND